VELLSLIGDIALKDGEQVNAHAVAGRSDGTAHGGYLVEARVRPTCELILTERPIHLQKKFDPKLGIAEARALCGVARAKYALGSHANAIEWREQLAAESAADDKLAQSEGDFALALAALFKNILAFGLAGLFRS
jgi:hypothetical protein